MQTSISLASAELYKEQMNSREGEGKGVGGGSAARPPCKQGVKVAHVVGIKTPGPTRGIGPGGGEQCSGVECEANRGGAVRGRGRAPSSST